MHSTSNTLRRASTHASSTTTSSRLAPSIQTRRSTDSRVLEDILQDGDEVGPGLSIFGQSIRIVSARDSNVPALKVIRKLGTGSYAVVYLAQEIVPYNDNFLDIVEDSPPPTPAPVGRYFAIKCLAKHALDQDAQLLEATIHQSLPVHDNVVTLWTTLETTSYLLLVLDYVPGEDLFYFLEQGRDQDDALLPGDGPSASVPSVATLPPHQLLSTARLQLIASMFSQMCKAVAHCHQNGVFHRDIKPENFMVTDSRSFNPINGKHERRVTVKLTDFGLATRDTESGDMDCGSAPYMSFECHNNITPTYSTAPADVWSLGIVLINMLYHANPWLTTAINQCESFDYFLREPIPFFMNRFPGMTPAVAEYFGRRVFCLLGDHPYDQPSMATSVSAHYSPGAQRRVTAAQFGHWARDLPLHLGPSARRTPALAFQQTPSPPSAARPRSPGELSNRLMAPSLSQPGTRTPSPSYRTRPPVPVHADNLASNPNGIEFVDLDSDLESDDGERTRTTSSRRRKRAPRGKTQANQQMTAPAAARSDAALYAASVIAQASDEQRLAELVEKSQLVAREASLMKLTKTPPSAFSHLDAPSDVALTFTPATPSTISNLSTVMGQRSIPELRKKKSSKWTDIFKRDSGSDQEVMNAADLAAIDQEKEERTSLSSPVDIPAPSATAKNIASLIMGLDSAPPSLSNTAEDDRATSVSGGRSSSVSSRGRRKDKRAGIDRDTPRASSPGSLFSVSTASTGASKVNAAGRGRSEPSNDRRPRSKSPTQAAIAQFNLLLQTSAEPLPPVPSVPEPYRASVPVPTQVAPATIIVSAETHQPSSRRSYAPSIASVSTATTSSSGFTAFSGRNNWRSSSSAGSTFTRYSNSNASVRSVSTAATSVSSGSWRQPANGNRPAPPPLPSNIKQMDGIPRILDKLPQHRSLEHRKKNNNNRRPTPSAPTSPGPGSSFKLDPIAEKPKKSSMKPPRSPVAPSFDQARHFGGSSSMANDDFAGPQSGMQRVIGSFDPSGTSFAGARGMPIGLQINTEMANAGSQGVGVPRGSDPAKAEVPALAGGNGKPPKTPTKSRLWNWRK